MTSILFSVLIPCLFAHQNIPISPLLFCQFSLKSLVCRYKRSWLQTGPGCGSTDARRFALIALTKASDEPHPLPEIFTSEKAATSARCTVSQRLRLRHRIRHWESPRENINAHKPDFAARAVNKYLPIFMMEVLKTELPPAIAQKLADKITESVAKRVLSPFPQRFSTQNRVVDDQWMTGRPVRRKVSQSLIVRHTDFRVWNTLWILYLRLCEHSLVICRS